jgi:site-specific DNA-methyltransferase (adenine-specific)
MLPKPDIDVRIGDCLHLLQEMEEGIVDLAYLDPPFFTQKVHRLSPRNRSREFSFQDLWESQQAYAEFLHTRLLATHRVLSGRGAIFFHCDRNAAHVVRLLLDDVFGSENFRSEIIWHYRRWSNSRRGLLPSHQTILYYTKSENYIFNEILTDYSPTTNVDQILQRRARDNFNKSVYDRDSDGNVVSNGAKRGVPLSDVWDIPFLNPKAKERTGYPTQKPLQLLERIILMATMDDSCVLDPFCGSGTTLVAAQGLGRSAIGIDVSAAAADLTRRRLREPVRSQSRLLELGRDAYRNADEVVLSVLQGLEFVPVQRNSGIDVILKQSFQGGPVPIRVQRPGETLLDAAQKLFKASAGKGAKVMFVVAATRGGAFDFTGDLPVGVVVVDSPALSIKEQLSLLKSEPRTVRSV